MKWREIFRFELSYQLRRLATWLPFVVLGVVAFLFVRGGFLSDALLGDFHLNSPFIIAATTVFCTLLWLLMAAANTGEIAARDAQTGMHPLTYTAPVSKTEYLGGRFLAALVLNLLVLLAVPLGIMVSVYGPGVDPRVVGEFRWAPYVTAFGFISLPNAFIGTSVQFAWATLGRRPILSYLGSVFLVVTAYGGIVAVMFFLERQEIAFVLDVFGHIYLTSEMVLGWTPIEKSTRLIELRGPFLHSRLFWVSLAAATLAFTHARFRFAHHTAGGWWSRIARRRDVHAPTPAAGEAAARPISVPHARRTFGPAMRARQTWAVARTSFGSIARSRGGLVLLLGIAAVAALVVPKNFENMGSPLLPRTEYVLTFLTSRLTTPMTPWVVIPLLLIFYAGELVWREREAGLGEIADAAPVPEWVPLLGKFLALGMVLVVWETLVLGVGVLTQARLGYSAHELGLFTKVLYGLQLPEYLLFALLALVIQGLSTQKYLGHLAVLLAFVSILFASWMGIEHHLLVFGSAPAWFYTDMRGFGASLGPWRWFMLYWAAWALLLAVVARLLWVRGLERGVGTRLRMARGRLTGPTLRVAVLAVGLVVSLGGFIFYNTNVRNEYVTASDVLKRRAEYERRYGRYEGVPQPRLAGTSLRVEMYPERQAVEIRGTYVLVNRGTAPIDSLHVAPALSVETGDLTLDRPARHVVADDVHRHHVFALAAPLRPGDSVRLGFTVRMEPRGFRNGGTAPFLTPNATFFRSNDWLPALGYQPRREILGAAERRKQGLPARPLLPTLADAAANGDITGEAASGGAERITFEAVVGTASGQTAVAPGALRRTWTEGGRRYFHYATDTPIGTEYAFFSAAYAVHEEVWTPPAGMGVPITVQVYHHPRHTANLDRLLRSVRASLSRYTRAYGPYPHGRILRLVENPGGGIGAHAEPTTIDYTEGFTRFAPGLDPQGLDLPFAVMAHEMAHEWGVPYAVAEGAPLLTESFAWYAAMGVVDETYGREHLERLRRFFRQPHPIPPIRQSLPLLRAMDPYAAYRKGPAALFALAEYSGRERVDLAFRHLIETPRPGGATSLDLYRELERTTPDSLRYLLHDMLAANTFWQLKTERATARKTADGRWEVTLRLRARKVTVDTAGMETEVPMDEWVPIGVFGKTGESFEFGETLYLRMHRIRSGRQRITLTVPREPADAGIDPYLLLIDLERYDNVEEVEVERRGKAGYSVRNPIV